jgi:hypothetical protein
MQMGVLYPNPSETESWSTRPGTYRRLDATANDRWAQEADRRVAKLRLQMQLPQMRRDARDGRYSDAERAFIAGLIQRI